MKCSDGSRERRRVDAHFVPAMAAFFGEAPPGFGGVDQPLLAYIVRRVEQRYADRIGPDLKSAIIAGLYRRAVLAETRPSDGEIS